MASELHPFNKLRKRMSVGIGEPESFGVQGLAPRNTVHHEGQKPFVYAASLGSVKISSIIFLGLFLFMEILYCIPNDFVVCGLSNSSGVQCLSCNDDAAALKIMSDFPDELIDGCSLDALSIPYLAK